MKNLMSIFISSFRRDQKNYLSYKFNLIGDTGTNFARTPSRSSSPVPSMTGMAARKFLARPSIENSGATEIASSLHSAASLERPKKTLASKKREAEGSIESKDGYDLSSFSFENLNRLSELNMEAAARAQTQSHS